MDRVKVVQITDLHLMKEQQNTLLGVTTLQSLHEVLALVQTDPIWPADVILATGDLAQDESREAYQHMTDSFNGLSVPYHCIPGNHDNPTLMQKCIPGHSGGINRKILFEHWQIVLLSSHKPEHVEGYLNEETLAFLNQALASHPNHHTLIGMHHPTVQLGSRWIDSLAIENPEAFFSVVQSHQNVRAVIWGHAHQEFDQQRDGIRLLGTPSTCFQFKPNVEQFALDDQFPGYRSLTLHKDGHIETTVSRLAVSSHVIDYSAQGY